MYRVQYFILKEFKLVVSQQKGLIELNKLIASMIKLQQQSDFSAEYNFLIDLRESEFSNNVDKIKEFVEFLNMNFSISLRQRIALLTNESGQVAMATIFKMLQKKHSPNIHIFSTLKHTLLWLHVYMDDQQMEMLLKLKQVQKF